MWDGQALFSNVKFCQNHSNNSRVTGSDEQHKNPFCLIVLKTITLMEGMKCVFHFSPQLLFETFFALIII
jgi:hypothetical protein